LPSEGQSALETVLEDELAELLPDSDRLSDTDGSLPGPEGWLSETEPWLSDGGSLLNPAELPLRMPLLATLPSLPPSPLPLPAPDPSPPLNELEELLSKSDALLLELEEPSPPPPPPEALLDRPDGMF
jgi:hypothetical protein